MEITHLYAMIHRYIGFRQQNYMGSQEQKLPSKKYLDYIREKPCLVCGITPCDPDHLEAVGMGGANRSGYKDYSCIPLCRMHHTHRHQMGNVKFMDTYKINIWKDAFNLIRRYFVEIS